MLLPVVMSWKAVGFDTARAVKSRIDVAQATRRGLVQDGKNARKGWRSDRSAPHHIQAAVTGAKAVYATALRTDKSGIVRRRGIQAHVRNVPVSIGRGQSILKSRLGEFDAGPASRGRERSGGCRDRSRSVIPCGFGNVDKRRTDVVGGSRSAGPVRRIGAGVSIGRSSGHEFQRASPVNSVPPIPVTSGTLAGASTASPLTADLAVELSQSAAPESPAAAVIVWPWELASLRVLPQRQGKCAQGRFAVSVAGADHRRQIVVDGKLEGIKGVQRRIAAGVYVENRRILGDAARPFHIEIGLDFIPGGESSAAVDRNQLKIGRRQSSGGAKGVDV